jgi:hypothetical protein
VFLFFRFFARSTKGSILSRVYHKWGIFGVKGEGVKMRPWLMMIAEAGFPLPLV